ncbi:MAG TPA: thiamine-phosphate kinase, partial [Burkholderiales bacterium]|nr:thiamine-phosphate kinase [Burkholderiales bacterium]
DLAHILERSRLSARIEYARIPRAKAFQALKDPELEKNCVLSGGDDYELLFTAPHARRAEIDALAAELKLALTRIGSVAPGEPRLTVLDASGRPLEHRGGFDHFGGR